MPLMNRLLCFAVLLALIPDFTLAAEREDILVTNFDGLDYGAWKTTGEAFGTGPARGALPGQMAVEGFEGPGLVNSFVKGDATTGTLTSLEITLSRKYLAFLIGGGKHPGQTCINLLLDGKVVRTATGPNGQLGGSERLDWESWDVSDLNGKPVVIQIVDTATGGWGHINIDQIIQSDTRRGNTLVRREILVDKDFLHLPVKNGAAKKQIKFLVDGKTVREFEIELDAIKPDFTTFTDVRKWRGQALTIETQLPYDSKLLDSITAQDTIPVEQETYKEKHRPQFHFTSRRGWLNDPNGLVYHAGEWHLFYQHNPYGWGWGNMHWGHAVSRDLFHWQELPTAIYPRHWGDFAFSGSAIVDTQNAAGFKSGKEDVLLAFYTSTGRGECLAFSNDNGRTWRDYEHNPIVRHQGRDPKVVWHAASKAWVMAVYDESPNIERNISFYTSKNLKEWTFASRIFGFYECPDLFELKLENDPKVSRWVLYGADGKYLLGDFDGKQFHTREGKHQLWHGNFYAAQTYSDAPDGRRVQIGWANGIAFPGMPFNQQMTVPVELTLKSNPLGYAVSVWPVKELAELTDKSLTQAIPENKQLTLKAGKEVPLTGPSESLDLFDLSLEIEPDQLAEKVVLTVQGTPITYDVQKEALTCRHVTALMMLDGGKFQLRVLGDRNSLEIFGNGGKLAISVGGLPSDTDRTAKCVAIGAEATLRQIELKSLKSAWKKP
jgi:fructan beta-fructosidase